MKNIIGKYVEISKYITSWVAKWFFLWDSKKDNYIKKDWPDVRNIQKTMNLRIVLKLLPMH